MEEKFYKSCECNHNDNNIVTCNGTSITFKVCEMYMTLCHIIIYCLNSNRNHYGLLMTLKAMIDFLLILVHMDIVLVQ